MPTLNFSLTRVKSLLGGDAFNWIRQQFPQIIRDGSGLPIGLQDNDGNAIAGGGGISAGNINTFTKPQRAQIPLVAYSATVTLDFGASLSFEIGALTGNIIIANPINMPAVGETQSGVIYLTQDAAGGRTITFGNNFSFTGTAPVLSTAPNARDRLTYVVNRAGKVEVEISKGLTS